LLEPGPAATDAVMAWHPAAWPEDLLQQQLPLQQPVAVAASDNRSRVHETGDGDLAAGLALVPVGGAAAGPGPVCDVLMDWGLHIRAGAGD